MLDLIKKYLNSQNISFLKESDFQIEFLAQGEYNQNFLIKTSRGSYVFRVNLGSQINISNQISYEYNALKRLEVTQKTPKVYYIDDSLEFFPHGVLIMEFLEGRPLNYETDLSIAADIFQKIHKTPIITHDYQMFITENYLLSDRIKEGKILLHNIWDSSLISKEIKVFFEKFLDRLINMSIQEKYFILDPWHVICNTEVNSHNFIIGKNDSWLIDWEKPVISDPCQDITQFLAKTTTLWKQNTSLSNEAIEQFYQSYENTFPDKNIRERVEIYTPYLYLRALAWCASAYLEYQNPKKMISNKDTYQKIQEYLNINFMNDLVGM